jgi:S-phase kinase-associated protein 1
MAAKEGSVTIICDGGSTITPLRFAMVSKLVEAIAPEEKEIPLPGVTKPVMEKVLAFNELYLSKGGEFPEIEKPIKSTVMADVVPSYYAEFIDPMTIDEITLLLNAANYLDVRPLLDLCCCKLASMIKGKTPEEIRTLFNIANDFTPEEEAAIGEENKWCEDI